MIVLSDNHITLLLVGAINEAVSGVKVSISRFISGITVTATIR